MAIHLRHHNHCSHDGPFKPRHSLISECVNQLWGLTFGSTSSLRDNQRLSYEPETVARSYCGLIAVGLKEKKEKRLWYRRDTCLKSAATFQLRDSKWVWHLCSVCHFFSRWGANQLAAESNIRRGRPYLKQQRERKKGNREREGERGGSKWESQTEERQENGRGMKGARRRKCRLSVKEREMKSREIKDRAGKEKDGGRVSEERRAGQWSY